jgi:hypothetical protein
MIVKRNKHGGLHSSKINSFFLGRSSTPPRSIHIRMQRNFILRFRGIPRGDNRQGTSFCGLVLVASNKAEGDYFSPRPPHHNRGLSTRQTDSLTFHAPTLPLHSNALRTLAGSYSAVCMQQDLPNQILNNILFARLARLAK